MTERYPREGLNLCLHQVFDSKESLSTAAECVKVAKEHCRQLTEIGLDLTFTLQSLLVKDIKAALLSYNDIIIEATKHRNSEEMWRRMNLMTPEALAKLKVESFVVFISVVSGDEVEGQNPIINCCIAVQRIQLFQWEDLLP